jgi:hypothetical protein
MSSHFVEVRSSSMLAFNSRALYLLSYPGAKNNLRITSIKCFTAHAIAYKSSNFTKQESKKALNGNTFRLGVAFTDVVLERG